MKILFLGDVVGRAARDAIIKALPSLREEWALDFVIINAENAAGGFGITSKIAKAFLEAGADVLTTGNHVWDQPNTAELLESERRILRPHNYPPQTPGAGGGIFETRRGKKICVVNLMGRLFMPMMIENPFTAALEWMDKITMMRDADAFIIDMHAEAASEKMAMGHLCDGKVSLVIGSHTHAPTSDEQILPHGTAYMTDAGMCGDYDSIVGFDQKRSLARFVTARPMGRLEVAGGEPTLCGALLETDPKTGLAQKIQPFRTGGRLAPAP